MNRLLIFVIHIALILLVVVILTVLIPQFKPEWYSTVTRNITK